MKRIHSADLMKSFMIIVVILGHRIFYDWAGYHNPTEGNVHPLLLVFGFFAAMGSIFAYVTGLVTSFSVFQRISRGRNSRKQLVLASLVTFLCLAFINYFILYFFSGGVYIDGAYHYGLLVRAIEFGQLKFPGLELLLLYAGVLMSIGVSGFAVTTVVALLFRGSRGENLHRHNTVLIGLGVAILALSAYLPFRLDPIMLDAFDRQNYFLAFLLANSVAFDFPVFPLLGFAMIGAALGLYLASGQDRHKMMIQWSRFATGIIVVGLVLSAIFLLQGQLIFNFARYVHLGIYIFITLALLHRIDFRTDAQREQSLKRFSAMLRFGKVTLTIFVFETPLATILHLIPNRIFPGWDSNLGLVLLFALLNVLLWWFVLRLWEENSFKGSLEWMIAKIIRALSGKTSDNLIARRARPSQS